MSLLLQQRCEQLVYQLSYSSLREVKAAAKEAKQRGNDLARPGSTRVVWKALHKLLKTEERKF